MKVLKGKTMRKLKDKISTSTASNQNNNRKKKSKPMIRKIEEGEDLVVSEYKPPSAADIIDDLDRKPAAFPDLLKGRSEVSCPMDESPTKKQMVDVVPSQLFAAKELSKKEEMAAELDVQDNENLNPTEQALPQIEEEEALWKLEEPEIGEEIPDQEQLGLLEESFATDDFSSQEDQSDEDENDISFEEYTAFNGGNPPVAVIGNIMLISAEKETPKSPFSTAPTEPATPEEALKRSFEIKMRDDDFDNDSFSPNYIPKTTTYNIPNEDEEAKTLWNRLEKNVELSQNLLKDFNCESHVEKTVHGFGYRVQKPDLTGVEITVTGPEEKEEEQEVPPAPALPSVREERKSVGETIVKKSFLDDTQFQMPSDDDNTEHNNDAHFLQVVPTIGEHEGIELEESVLTVPTGNGLNTSFEMPFDQKQQMQRDLAPPPVVEPTAYLSPQIADEEEFPDDEVHQELNDFFQEIEEQQQQPEDDRQKAQETDSVFYSATLSVAKSVQSASVVSVASATAQTVATAANSLDQASAPALDTIIEKTSAAMTPTAFDGFFDNPKPRKKSSTTKQQQVQDYNRGRNDSFNSDDNSYGAGSEEPPQRMTHDAESVDSRFGFDKTMDGWFASDTFTGVTKHVPDFMMQLVLDDTEVASEIGATQ
ncbi:MAG: hypothetical protein SGBAC_007091 [Bacillariaceae sp.]